MPAPTQPITAAQWAKFHQLACDLSPENLSCDGLLSATRIKARYTALRRAWKQLEQAVGRKVSEQEAWDNAPPSPFRFAAKLVK